MTYRGGMRRFTEETTPNVKNRSHSIVAHIETIDTDTGGVIAAQGGRFGGWSLYCAGGCAYYAYNYFGLCTYRIGGSVQIQPGRHEVRMDFEYDGGGVGKGGTVVLSVDDEKQAEGRVEQTIAYYFSFDETLDIGVDLGTPVTDDYPEVDNTFSGLVHTVQIDLGEEDEGHGDGGLHRRVMTSH